MTTRGCSWIPLGTRRLVSSWRSPHRTPRVPVIEHDGPPGRMCRLGSLSDRRHFIATDRGTAARGPPPRRHARPSPRPPERRQTFEPGWDAVVSSALRRGAPRCPSFRDDDGHSFLPAHVDKSRRPCAGTGPCDDLSRAPATAPRRAVAGTAKSSAPSRPTSFSPSVTPAGSLRTAVPHPASHFHPRMQSSRSRVSGEHRAVHWRLPRP